MNEVSMRERGQRAVTWDELKAELYAVAEVLSAMAVAKPKDMPALLANFGHAQEATLFGQMLTMHWGPPRASD